MLGKTNFPPGGIDTSDATAAAGDIVAPKTAYGAAGTKLTGTVPEKVGSATVITPSTADQAIPAGRYGGVVGDGKVSGSANLVAANIKNGVTIFSVTGTYDYEATNPIAAATVLNTKVGFVNGAKVTGTMTNVGAQSITPAAAGNTITAGYHNGSGGVAADAYFIAANIKSGVNIWGVTGTYTGATTKHLVFLTTTGANNWTVPSDWNSANNTIEVIGGGAGGRRQSSSSYRSGGGGGAYSIIFNLTLTPAASIAYNVGIGGGGYTAGGDTWFGNSVYASAKVAAKGGVCPSNSSALNGGQASGGIGTFKSSGGNGVLGYDSGGGGAGGPHGDGKDATSNTGGYGDNLYGGVGGANDPNNHPVTSPGGNGTEWDSTHGCGGGGGIYAGDTGSVGANGGNYGGGGGAGYSGAGSGGQGLIIITYYT